MPAYVNGGSVNPTCNWCNACAPGCSTCVVCAGCDPHAFVLAATLVQVTAVSCAVAMCVAVMADHPGD